MASGSADAQSDRFWTQIAASTDVNPDPPAVPQRIAVVPVLPGDVVPLPFEQDMRARLGPNGNLAVKSGDLTIILQGYVAADLREPVTILAANNQVIDVAALLEATGAGLDIPTAVGGPVAAPFAPGDDVTGNGIFTSFVDPGADPALIAAGTLDGTELATDPAAFPAGRTPPPILPDLPPPVVPPNRPPAAADVAVTALEDGAPVSAAFQGSDPDADDQGKLSYGVVSPPAQGTLTDNGDGTFTFDPGAAFQALAEGETQLVTASYIVTDAEGLTDQALINIIVTGVNDAPAVQDLALAAEEGGLPVDGNFIGDDPDNDDDPASLIYTITSPPQSGSVINNGDGTFTFDPEQAFTKLRQGESDIVTFTYVATDRHGAVSNTGTVTVTIVGTDNAAPTAQDIKLAAVEDGSAVDAAFLGDDPDDDDDPSTLAYLVTTPPIEGAVVDNKDGTFSFDPGTDFQDLAEGETRDVTFKYRAIDSHGSVSPPATVTVTVTGINDAPAVADIKFAATENGPAIGGAFSGDDADSDDDPDSLTYTTTSQPAEGSIAQGAGNAFTFDPGADFQDLAAGQTRDVTFTYTATDQHGAVSNVGTVTITVTGANDAPAARDITLKANEDGPAIPAAFDGDDPDSDDDPASLKYTLTSQPAEGMVTNNGDGTFSFDPGDGFQDLAVGATRNVTFKYTATDAHNAASSEAAVTVTVTGVNDVPTAEGLSASVGEGKSLTANFKADDIDSDDDPATLAYAIVAPPPAGTVTINPDGTFTFATGSDFDDLLIGQTRTVTFTYTATDRHGAASAPATVTITVIGANIVPPDPDACLPPLGQLANYTYVPGTNGNDTLNPGGNNSLWIQGFKGDDSLTGTSLADLLEGGAGNDTIDGGSGADVVLGGQGNDTILGGDAEDCIGAGDGNDKVDGGNSNDNLRGDGGDDVINGGNGDDKVDGGDGNDVIFGEQGNDRDLDGGAGDDEIHGGAGDDTVNGGDGNDKIFGEDSNDTLNGDAGDDEIHGAQGDDKIAGGAGNDKLFGEDNNDTIDGGEGDDYIEGGQGDDRLTGGGGFDILVGGQGHDTINGDGGDIIIQMTNVLDAGDVIDNFDANPDGGNDRLDLDALFDSLEGTLGSLSAQTRSNMLSFATSEGALQIFVDDDNNAGTASILLATLTAGGSLTVGTTLIVDSP